MLRVMWIFYALMAAVFAAAVAIFGKLGLKSIDPTLATAVRSIIMAGFMISAAFALGKFNGFTLNSFSGREWLLIAGAGVAGALSWLFYFVALKEGPATGVAALDRLSVVFVIVLAAIFLGEALTWKTVFGGLLITFGALLFVL